jgi:hypothetical protein
MEHELADYIFNYCHEFYNEKERKAMDHYFGQAKFRGWPDNASPQMEKAKERFRTDDSEALKLLEGGYAKFIMKTAERIYEEHKSELILNLCPKCNRISRTPTAKQCRFCGHDWHEKNLANL